MATAPHGDAAPPELLHSFLARLREIVDASPPIACAWGAGGDSFVVSDAFDIAAAGFLNVGNSGTDAVQNFTAFLRELVLFGFRKTQDGENAWEFHHTHFIKGKPELMSQIRRKSA